MRTRCQASAKPRSTSQSSEDVLDAVQTAAWQELQGFSMNGECPRTTASYSFLLAARTPGLHCRAKALSSEEGLQIDYVTPLYGLTLRSLSLASKRTKNSSRTAAQLESDSREYTEGAETAQFYERSGIAGTWPCALSRTLSCWAEPSAAARPVPSTVALCTGRKAHCRKASMGMLIGTHKRSP